MSNRVSVLVQQGTEAWHQVRMSHFTASELPAALGVSPYMTRAELMRIKRGEATEEKRGPHLAAGAEAERQARMIVEKRIDEDLFPETVARVVEGVKLLASLDGITIDGKMIFEHKLYREDLAKDIESGNIPAHIDWQIQQQLLVSGADECLLVCSDGTTERWVERKVEPDTKKQQHLVEAWQQFIADMQSAREEKASVAKSFSLPALDDAKLLNAVADELQKAIDEDDFAVMDAAAKAIKKASATAEEIFVNRIIELGGIAIVDAQKAMKRLNGLRLAAEKKVAAERERTLRAIAERAQATVIGSKHADAIVAEIQAQISRRRSSETAENAAFGVANQMKDAIKSNEDNLCTIDELRDLLIDESTLVRSTAVPSLFLKKESIEALRSKAQALLDVLVGTK